MLAQLQPTRGPAPAGDSKKAQQPKLGADLEGLRHCAATPCMNISIAKQMQAAEDCMRAWCMVRRRAGSYARAERQMQKLTNNNASNKMYLPGGW